MKGKKVLLMPYWLDDFGTGFTNWMARDLKDLGIDSTIYDAQGTASRSINELNTAIASGQYAGIIWAPVDESAALATVQRVEASGISQVVFGNIPSLKTYPVPQVRTTSSAALYQPGVIAAKYIQAHPELGAHPVLAFSASSPPNTNCTDRLAGLLAGMKSIDPLSSVAFQLGATSIAQADTQLSDFITRGIKFNVYDGCGSSPSEGGYAALKAAHLADATDKTPAHVFIMTDDGTPSQVAAVMDSSTSAMVTTLLPPKDVAQNAVNLLVKVMTGQIAKKSTDSADANWIPILPDCDKYLSLISSNFDGVKGFSVPACKLTAPATGLATPTSS